MTATALKECPSCGADVAGCDESIADGQRRFTQPAGSYIGQTGVRIWTGGLTHIEGGARCTADAEFERRRQG